MKGYTSIKQSKKLLELGLNPESADMHYINEEHAGFPSCSELINSDNPWLKGVKLSPCWSLAALLELMPDVIEEDSVVFGLNIKKNFVEYYSPSMGALYATYHSVNAETIIDAAFEMVCWLLEQKLIKTE